MKNGDGRCDVGGRVLRVMLKIPRLGEVGAAYVDGSPSPGLWYARDWKIVSLFVNTWEFAFKKILCLVRI